MIAFILAVGLLPFSLCATTLALPRDQWPTGPLAASLTEDVLDVLWSAPVSDLKHWKLTGNAEGRASLKQSWASVNLQVRLQKEADNRVVIERAYPDVDIRGYEALILRIALSKGQNLAITPTVDGQTGTATQAQGTDTQLEIMVPLAGAVLEKLQLVFTPDPKASGDQTAILSWTLLRKRSTALIDSRFAGLKLQLIKGGAGTGLIWTAGQVPASELAVFAGPILAGAQPLTGTLYDGLWVGDSPALDAATLSLAIREKGGWSPVSSVRASRFPADSRAWSIPRVAREPTLDGLLDEWTVPNENNVIVIGAGGRRTQATGWEGPDDLAGVAALSWDEKALYVAVKVADDVVRNTQPQKIWEGDAVLIGLGFAGVTPAQSDFDLLVSPGDPAAGLPPSAWVLSQRGQNYGPSDKPPFSGAFRIQRTKDGYDVEVALPWAVILPPRAAKPVADMPLLVNLGIFDSDITSGDTARQSVISWTASTAMYSPVEAQPSRLAERASPTSGGISLAKLSPALVLKPILAAAPAVVGEKRFPRTFAANLLITPAEADAWRATLSADATGRALLAAITSRAAPFVDYDPAPFLGEYIPAVDNRFSRVGASNEQWDKKLTALASAYLVTGDLRTGEAARRLLLALSRTPNWCESFMQRVLPGSKGSAPFYESDHLVAAALAYDWCYELLTPAERVEAAQGMYRAGVRQIAGWLPTQNYWRRMNQGPIFSSSLALGALAIRNVVPEAQADLDYGREAFLSALAACFDEDGGHYEYFVYWNFTLTHSVEGLTALSKADPKFMERIPSAVRRSMEFARAMRSTTTVGRFAGENFGDAGFGAPIDSRVLLFFGRFFGDGKADALWRENYAQSPGADICAALWYDPARFNNLADTEALDAPLRLFRGVGFANLRSGPATGNDAVSFSLMSGPWGRSHGDKNSFILGAYGERFAIDPGMMTYSNPRHLQLKETAIHSVITIGNTGQDHEQGDTRRPAARIERAASSGDFSVVISDAAQAYKPALVRARRAVFFARPDVWLMVDDVATGRPPAPIAWRMTSGVKNIELGDRAALLRGSRATLSLFSLESTGGMLARRDVLTERGDFPQLTITTPDATEARFITLLAADRGTAETSAAPMRIEAVGARAWSLKRGTDSLVFVVGEEDSWTVGKLGGSSRVAIIQIRDGKPVEALADDGTPLQWDGHLLPAARDDLVRP